jgi:hypothetical protein
VPLILPTQGTAHPPIRQTSIIRDKRKKYGCVMNEGPFKHWGDNRPDLKIIK